METFDLTTRVGIIATANRYPAMKDFVNDFLDVLERIKDIFFKSKEKEEFEMVMKLIETAKKNGAKSIKIKLHRDTYTKFSIPLEEEGEVSVKGGDENTVVLVIEFK